MSKYHKIRWQDADNRELKRVVRNYNAKINRLARKNPEIKNILPEKVQVRQLKELINTRQDLKRELNSLKRFSKKGSERIVEIPNTDDNLKITKWQMQEMNRRVAVINRRREKRLKLIETTEVESRGEKTGYTRGQIGMGKVERNALLPMNAFYPSMDSTGLKKKWDTILRHSQTDYFDKRDYQLRENFIQGLVENYRIADIEDVIERIRNMDIKDFLQEFYKDPEAFEWAYPPTEEEYQGYVSVLKSTWNPER